ncbi:MAG: ABC transporter permease, partial [Shimia sp.]
MRVVLPVLTVVGAIFALWYLLAVPMNAHQAVLDAERAGEVVSPPTASERRALGGIAVALRNPSHLSGVWAQERPRLPAPHQIAVELWETT